MAKYDSVWGHCETIAEPVKKLQKGVNFSQDVAESGKKGGYTGVMDARPSSDDNQLGKGHPKGFAGKPNDNRADRNRKTTYGKG